MRIAPETGNQVSIGTRLAQRKLVIHSEALRRVERHVLRQRHNAIKAMQMTRPLGVRQGQEEECLLPRLRQRIIVTIPKSLFGDPERLRVGRISLRLAGELSTRKLVEYNDQREPAAWRREPMVEPSQSGSHESVRKGRQLRVRAARKPPLDPATECFPVGVLETRWKPEIVNLFLVHL